MENYPSNSRSGREKPQEQKEPKKIERVVTGKSLRRKKPLGTRLAETFIGGSDTHSVWEYVFFDVLVPAAKDMVSDAVSQGIERMLFGEVRGRGGRSRSNTPYTNYSSSSRYNPPGPMMRRDEPRRPELSRQDRAQHRFDQIIIPTRTEATEILDQMYSVLSQYDVVTVSDLYEMANIESQFTDERYGWDDLSGSGVSRDRKGYLLVLPQPKELH